MNGLRQWTAAAATVILAAGLSGCHWRGLNSLPLPGTEGGGRGSYTVTVELPDVSNIQPNSRVRVADVTVGNVRKIERQGWHAAVTVTLNGDVACPPTRGQPWDRPACSARCTSNCLRRPTPPRWAGSERVR